MRCIFCNDEFEVNKKGRKKNYCDKPECKKEAIKLSRKKWLEKRKLQKEIGRAEVVIQNEDKNIIYSIEDKLENESKMPDISDIVELARQLGSIRLQLIEKIEKSRNDISECDKSDSDLVHELEALNSVTSEYANSFTVGVKKNHERRRIAKNRYYIIKALLDSMLMKNPPQFVAQAIQRSKNFKYVPRILKELKQDESLYGINDEEIEVVIETN